MIGITNLYLRLQTIKWSQEHHHFILKFTRDLIKFIVVFLQTGHNSTIALLHMILAVDQLVDFSPDKWACLFCIHFFDILIAHIVLIEFTIFFHHFSVFLYKLLLFLNLKLTFPLLLLLINTLELLDQNIFVEKHLVLFEVTDWSLVIP